MKPSTLSLMIALLIGTTTQADPAPLENSKGIYRLPYAEGTKIKIFDDALTHGPRGRVDMTGSEGQAPYRIVAAAAGRVVAIQDSYSEQQTGRAAADCRNNFIWIAHANGEWSNYSHLRQGSITGSAKLKVGDEVQAGTYLGDEGAVGCSMLEHLHFEIAVPDSKQPLDSGGFLLDNKNSQRERNPRFCNVTGPVVKDHVYTAAACPPSATLLRRSSRNHRADCPDCVKTPELCPGQLPD